MRSIHRRHDSAVAGVIEALLLVGLVAIVISMIQLVYIPQVMEQREADHMDQVFNQFSTIKSMVDMQSMSASSSPISSVLTLGSPRLPYFLTVQALGRVALMNESTARLTVNEVTQTDLASLHYEAQNAYFLDQDYILEGGGIIVSQVVGSPVMRADPSVSVENATKIVLHFSLPVFVDTTGKVQTEGEGKCFIRTTYLGTDTIRFDDITPAETIKIYSKYAAAWNQSLHNVLGEFDYNGCISITESSLPSPYTQIRAGTKHIDLSIDIIRIQVQIGPGWVE